MPHAVPIQRNEQRPGREHVSGLHGRLRQNGQQKQEERTRDWMKFHLPVPVEESGLHDHTKHLSFSVLRRPALWERILDNRRPMPKSLMEDVTEGWRLHDATDNSSFPEHCRRDEDSFTRRDVYVYPSSHSADLSLWAVVFCTCRQVSS